MIVLSRIDSRLVHGQVIEGWLPHLRVERLVVVDDVAAGDQLARSVMALAVPPEVKVEVAGINSVDFLSLAADSVRTLLLFRDVDAVVAARGRGLPDGPLNVGNIHSGPGRTAVSRSVFLSAEERERLKSLRSSGMKVQIQAVPAEKPTFVE